MEDLKERVGLEEKLDQAAVTGMTMAVWAEVQPDKVAVIDPNGREKTFAEVNANANKLARLFRQHGVMPGDALAIVCSNRAEFIEVLAATMRTGVRITPVNWHLTADEIAYIINDCEAKVLIGDARVGALTTAAKSCDNVVLQLAVGGSIDGFEDYDAALAPLDGSNIDNPVLGNQMMYTSGTTGRPKGALGTHRNIMCNLVNIAFAGARAFVRRGEPLPEPPETQKCTLLPVPFFHVTGCHSVLIPTVANGAKLVLMHKWNPERALELIETERVNATTGVPSMIWQLIESPDFAHRDLSSIEAISYGGAAAAPELARKVTQLFPGIWPGQGYGATETSSVSTSNSAEDYLARPTSVGPAVPGCDVRILDADGNVLPAGGVGEIAICGGNVIKGYWNNPQATAAAFRDGWYRTGDIGRMDEDGFVYLLDRAKDMLIRGGENIYCVEIEDALLTHPDIIDAAVIGIPDRVLGELVGAVVQTRAGATLTAAQIVDHLRPRLSAHKLPVRIDIRAEEFPRTASGKTMKNVLRREFADTQPV